MAVPARSRHSRNQSLRPGGCRVDHQGAGARVSRPGHRRLGTTLPHRHQGRQPPDRSASSSGISFTLALAAAPRRWGTAGRRPGRGRRRAASSSGASRWPKRAFPCSSSTMSSGLILPGTDDTGVGSARISVAPRDHRARCRQHRGGRRALSVIWHPRGRGRQAPSLSSDLAGAGARSEDERSRCSHQARRLFSGRVGRWRRLRIAGPPRSRCACRRFRERLRHSEVFDAREGRAAAAKGR